MQSCAINSTSLVRFILAFGILCVALLAGAAPPLAEETVSPPLAEPSRSPIDAHVSSNENRRSALTRLQPPQAEQGLGPRVRPNLRVLSIGVAEYQNPSLRLEYPARDAQDFSKLWSLQEGGMYGEVASKVLTNQEATKRRIEEGLEWIGRQTTEKDVAIVFLAGHGIKDPTTDFYYFLPFEADYELMLSTMVSQSMFRDWLAGVKGKVLFFLDTCHAGQVFPGERTRGLGVQTDFANELVSAPNGTVAFTSSTGNQLSLEGRTWGHGAFTKALIEGLSGRADRDGTGRVTVSMLDLYLSERVVELTGRRQRPNTAKPQALPDFPIAAVRWLRNEDVQPLR